MNTENAIYSTDLPWQQNSYITVERPGLSAVRIRANKEGLLSLAAHLEALANGMQTSILYDDTPGDLESGSLSLEIQKVECKGKFNYAHPFQFSQEHRFQMVQLPGLPSENSLLLESENKHLYNAIPEKRYQYLLHAIVKNHCLWMLGNGTEGLTLETECEKALLLWPEEAYAKEYAKETQQPLKVVCLTWEDLRPFIQKSLSDPAAGFLIFATRQNGYLVSADKFLADMEAADAI